MKTTLFPSLATFRPVLALCLVGASAQLSAQPVLYGLTSTNSLIFFSDDASTVVEGPAFSGLGPDETVVAIDFRLGLPPFPQNETITGNRAKAGRPARMKP